MIPSLAGLIESQRKPGHAGALAFSRTGDPSTGDFGEAKVIRKLANLSEL